MKSIRSFLFLLGFLFFTACNPVIKNELLPLLTTTEVSAITQISATSGGNITSDEGSSVTARGVCWSTKASPTISDSITVDSAGIGSYTSYITGLTAGTTYYVRAYATSGTGTGYGDAYQITTNGATPTVTDADGNVYHTITIGTQTWMVENLKTTQYNDGTAIPLVTDTTEWTNLSTPAYSWYNNDAATYKNKYGALYNWYAVNTGKLAPTGWHVPTDAEWTTLENYLTANGYNYNGSTSGDYYAKSLAATTDWTTDTKTGDIGDDLTENNRSGFSALPGGYRFLNGTFNYEGFNGYWWSYTEDNTIYAWYSSMLYSNSGVSRNNYVKQFGLSVRCVRDSQ